MLLLEATKLSADPEFSEFKPLMALARHAITLRRAAWFWSSLERHPGKKHTPPVSLPSTILKGCRFTYNFLHVFTMYSTVCILYWPNVEHYFSISARWKKLNLLFLKYVNTFSGCKNNAPKSCLNCAKLSSMSANSGDILHGWMS